LMGTETKPTKKFRHVFLDAEGTIYVPRKGHTQYEFWAGEHTPEKAMEIFELDEGAAEAIRELRREVDTLCLVSLNPQPVLDALLQKFGIKDAFDEIMLNGNKGQLIREYLRKHNLRTDQAIMVGDMPRIDLYPVKSVGIESLLIDRYYNQGVAAERIHGLAELPMWLRIADLVESMHPSPRVKPLDEFITAYELSWRRDNKTKSTFSVPG
jgi:FMN phosphatase YigB (HAD superfamily)